LAFLVFTVNSVSHALPYKLIAKDYDICAVKASIVCSWFYSRKATKTGTVKFPQLKEFAHFHYNKVDIGKVSVSQYTNTT